MILDSIKKRLDTKAYGIHFHWWLLTKYKVQVLTFFFPVSRESGTRKRPWQVLRDFRERQLSRARMFSICTPLSLRNQALELSDY